MYGLLFFVNNIASVVWHCWLGVRKSIRPIKVSDEVWLSVWNQLQIICIWSSWCRYHAIISCVIKIEIGLTFLVPAYPVCRLEKTDKRTFSVSNMINKDIRFFVQLCILILNLYVLWLNRFVIKLGRVYACSLWTSPYKHSMCDSSSLYSI